MMRRATSQFSARGGFTLLELLIATAVGSVVLIVIQTTFFGALRLHNTTHDRIETDAILHRALGIVRRDFAGLMLPGGALSGQFQTTNFSSMTSGSYGERVTPDLFTSSGKIDGWNPFSEVQMVAYYLAPATDGGHEKDLVRVVTRNLLPVQETAVEPEVLLHGVANATASFYDGSGWIDAWDSTATSSLPTGLKLTLTLAGASAQGAGSTVELIVPVNVVTTSQARAAEEGEVP